MSERPLNQKLKRSPARKQLGNPESVYPHEVKAYGFVDFSFKEDVTNMYQGIYQLESTYCTVYTDEKLG